MLIDGKKIAQKILRKLPKPPRPLKLAVVLVGNSSVSLKYIKKKKVAADELDIKVAVKHLAADISNNQLTNFLRQYQQKVRSDGLIIQLPLPKHLNTDRILNRIEPKLDVDCLTRARRAELIFRPAPLILPPVVAAIWEIIKQYKLKLTGKKIVVIGYGNLVGKPLIHTLLKRNLTITICQENCSSLAGLILAADIIISAAGQANLITGQMVKPGAVVIDCGTSESDGKLKGDVDFKSVSQASLITPPKGGIGPITIACLLRNLFILNGLIKNKP